jgi:hypothetical protein
MGHRIELRHWLLGLGIVAIALGAVASVFAADPLHEGFATAGVLSVTGGLCAGFGALCLLAGTVAWAVAIEADEPEPAQAP